MVWRMTIRRVLGGGRVYVITASVLVGAQERALFPTAGAEGDLSKGDMIVWEGPVGDGVDGLLPEDDGRDGQGRAGDGYDGLADVDLLGSFAVVGDGDDEAPDWQERALCAQTDPEAFFPEKGGSTREAKRICSGCEVRAECLEYALAHDERFGIWGGLSERERRRLRRTAG
jgi:WhiB family redox-sensing transcriptional regulator